MKLFKLLSVLLLFTAQQAASQDPQEWIQFDQAYIRIPVVENGWYRITAEDLHNTGIATDSLPPDCFQLFRRGQEVAIRIESKKGILQAIEFYGEKNDGARDSLLYTTPAAMPHSYFSLYSDTAAYFLTCKKSFLAGKRISQTTLTPSDTGISYHQQRLLQIYTDEYPAGNLYPMGAGYDNGTALSTYDEGEGWTGRTITAKSQQVLHFLLSRRVAETSSVMRLNLLLVGRNAGRHQVEVWAGSNNLIPRKLGEIAWLNYATAIFKTNLLYEDLSDDTLTIWLKPIFPSEQVSLSYAQLEYPQEISSSKPTDQAVFNFEPYTAYTLSSNTELTYFDITHPNNPIQLLLSESASHQFDITEKLLVVRKILQPTGLKLVCFEKIDPQLIDYLIISHPSVRKSNTEDPVKEYAKYRSSVIGGNFKPLVINSNEVFDQFNYGEPGPLGIRNLIKWLSDQGNLRYVFLMGTSRDPQTVRRSSNARLLDEIPSMGWPGSDIALAMQHTTKDQPTPVVPIGRLFASSPTDVSNYLKKVRQHESQSAAAGWRKQVLHVSGGRSVSELNFFNDFILQLKQKWDTTQVGVKITALSKKTDLPIESVPIAPLVNEGLSLITVIGHSGLGVTDIDLGLVSDPAYGYTNEGRYPAVMVNGCALGNYYYGPTTLSTDWIKTPKKGAILFLAHTHNGLTNSMKRYTSTIYDVLADPKFTSQAFGTVQKEAIRRFLGTNYVLSDLITAQQMNLQGDPAIKLFPAQFPDYAWQNNTFTVTDENDELPTNGSKQLTLKATLTNYGRYFNDSLSIQFRRIKNNELIQEFTFLYRTPTYTVDFIQTIPFSSTTSAKESWELTIDPQNLAREETKTNNTATREIYLASNLVIPILPVSGTAISKAAVELVAQLPHYQAAQKVVFQWSTNPDFSNATSDTITAHGIAAFKQLSLLPEDTSQYYWRVAGLGESFSSTFNFRYKPDVFSTDTPEGIAFVFSKIVGGETPIPQFHFQNISTTGFLDSLDVLITTFSTAESQQLKLKIPAIEPKETYSFQLPDTIVQTAGDYRVTVNFNSNMFPELFYENNTCETIFQIIADQIPPNLDVLIDHRRLAFNEAISKESIIEVRLSDSNTALPISDTSLVSIKLVNPIFSNKLVPHYWEFHSPNTLLLFAELPQNLPHGTYNLIVNGRDKSGNEAAVYTMQFRLTDNPLLTEAKVYPNPAQNWAHFLVELEGEEIPKEWLIMLFDSKGLLINTLRKPLHTGKNEQFWFPTELCSGIYYYQMEFSNAPANWSNSEHIQKQLRGKIIWKP